MGKKKEKSKNTRGELLLMCAVALQYSVPCLFLKYMKPDKLTKMSDSKVTILRTIIITIILICVLLK